MAIITEEPDASTSPPKKPTIKKPKLKPSPSPPPPSSNSNSNSSPNPFTFWFYFTISVSLLTLIFVTISSISSNQDSKTWFLTLPSNLRHHYSNGRTIKVQTTPHSDSIEVFTIQDGPLDSPHNVLIVHGLGCSSYSFSKIMKSLAKKDVHVVALDLPGSGFSDKFETVIEEKVLGGFDKLIELYNEIKEKGIFWGFDQLVEQGYVNYDYPENEIRLSKVKTLKPIELGPEETGRVLGQVIEAMGLSPVDLILHDSAFNLAANWVSKNPGFVRSLTLLDSSSNQPAFPLWVLKLPVIREIVSSFGFVYGNVIQRYCSRSDLGSDSDSHRLLLKGRDGCKSVVGMGNKLNSSFDIAEWSKLDGVKSLPIQVIWSSDWSTEWVKHGHEIAKVLPQASFVTHSGGRWPQESTSDEVAEIMHEFVSKLPKPIKAAKKKEAKELPDHIREMLHEATANVHHSHGHDHDHNHNHGHGQEVGYPSGYGLGHEFS